jgi:hypothetical protein
MPLDLNSNFLPGGVVVAELPESIQAPAQVWIKDWVPNQGKWMLRDWAMAKGGHKRTTQIGLERSGRLRTLKTPGGRVQIWSDDLYRMKLVDMIVSASPDAPPPKTIPKKKRQRLSRPRTQAELEALAKGRETMRRRREQDREEASAASRSESSAIHEDSAVS